MSHSTAIPSAMKQIARKIRKARANGMRSRRLRGTHHRLSIHHRVTRGGGALRSSRPLRLCGRINLYDADGTEGRLQQARAPGRDGSVRSWPPIPPIVANRDEAEST